MLLNKEADMIILHLLCYIFIHIHLFNSSYSMSIHLPVTEPIMLYDLGDFK